MCWLASACRSRALERGGQDSAVTAPLVRPTAQPPAAAACRSRAQCKSERIGQQLRSGRELSDSPAAAAKEGPSKLINPGAGGGRALAGLLLPPPHRGSSRDSPTHSQSSPAGAPAGLLLPPPRARERAGHTPFCALSSRRSGQHSTCCRGNRWPAEPATCRGVLNDGA